MNLNMNVAIGRCDCPVRPCLVAIDCSVAPTRSTMAHFSNIFSSQHESVLILYNFFATGRLPTRCLTKLYKVHCRHGEVCVGSLSFPRTDIAFLWYWYYDVHALFVFYMPCWFTLGRVDLESR
jgi:hypothetical protein